MQIKVLRKTVLEEYLTETVFDIQNFPRNLSARVLGWPFFQLSNTAQLTQGGQILLDPGRRDTLSFLWCLLCVPENQEHLLAPETQDLTSCLPNLELNRSPFREKVGKVLCSGLPKRR